MRKRFKKYNIGDSLSWEDFNGEGGRGIVVRREPYRAWVKCEDTKDVIKVKLGGPRR